MDMSGRTFQQQLVWTQLQNGVMAVERANDGLEGKAARLAGGSTAVIAAVTGLNLMPGAMLTKPEAVVLFVLCVTVLVMFWFAAKLWGPCPGVATTVSDTDKLYDEYMAKPEDVAFNNALIDAAKAFEYLVQANEQKGAELRHMLFTVQSQMVILGVLVLCKVFTG